MEGRVADWEALRCSCYPYRPEGPGGLARNRLIFPELAFPEGIDGSLSIVNPATEVNGVRKLPAGADLYT